ncbi:hypothetical protein NDN08_006258 [Rhodosorus marinus]|uniref:Uncharacterized protein n=1 Tax=Rhodosorus marinus TaxID=101924 RepID=A0AAV8UK61_9RHOD|nr:hypothetical protein NDN08_006258 [Rhodosorus marinus]
MVCVLLLLALYARVYGARGVDNWTGNSVEWREHGIILPLDIHSQVEFTSKVHFDGDLIVQSLFLGVPDTKVDGKVFSYRGEPSKGSENWELVQTIKGKDCSFGKAISADNTSGWMTISSVDCNCRTCGRVSLFKRQNGLWNLHGVFSRTSEDFGKSVSIHGEFVMISSTKSVFIFKLSEDTWLDFQQFDVTSRRLRVLPCEDSKRTYTVSPDYSARGKSFGDVQLGERTAVLALEGEGCSRAFLLRLSEEGMWAVNRVFVHHGYDRAQWSTTVVEKPIVSFDEIRSQVLVACKNCDNRLSASLFVWETDERGSSAWAEESFVLGTKEFYYSIPAKIRDREKNHQLIQISDGRVTFCEQILPFASAGTLVRLPDGTWEGKTAFRPPAREVTDVRVFCNAVDMYSSHAVVLYRTLESPLVSIPVVYYNASVSDVQVPELGNEVGNEESARDKPPLSAGTVVGIVIGGVLAIFLLMWIVKLFLRQTQEVQLK